MIQCLRKVVSCQCVGVRARLQDLEHEGGGGEAERRADDEGLEIINLQNYKIIKLF